MSGKKRQTFDKMNRERAVREKRARKQEKRELRKLAAQEPVNGDETVAEGADEEALVASADEETLVGSDGVPARPSTTAENPVS